MIPAISNCNDELDYGAHSRRILPDVDDEPLYLIFTTSQSEELFGGDGGENNVGPATFEGIYTCRFDVSSGTCAGQPMVVVNSFGEMEHSHQPHHGIDVMNIQLVRGGRTPGSGWQQFLYAGYYSGKRDSFEILRASDVSHPSNDNNNNGDGGKNIEMKFQSFFRTQKTVWNNEADNPLICEPGKSVGDTYFKVHPRDFVVVDNTMSDNYDNDKNGSSKSPSSVAPAHDGGDVYISWDGFYQNCSDVYASTKLLWTVGISKLIQSPECTLTDGMDEARFDDCTEVVAIAYQDTTAYETILGYAGISYATLPNGENLFFLSALDHINLDQKHLGKTKMYNELWVIKEGQNYAADPSVRQVFGRVEIDPVFMDVPCDDVGSIKLHKNEKGIATGICRSAYDAGIFCNSISISDEGDVTIDESYTFVTKEQIAQSCTVYKSPHYKRSERLSAVSTGIAVLWSDDSHGHMPRLITFGCYGEMNYHGNTTTVFDDGTVVQTIVGAYPGSLFFGPDLHHEEPPQPNDKFPSQTSTPTSPSSTMSNARPSFESRPLVFALLVIGIVVSVVVFKLRKRRLHRYAGGWDQKYRYIFSRIGTRSSNAEDVHDGTGIHFPTTGVQYVELSTTPTHSDETV